MKTLIRRLLFLGAFAAPLINLAADKPADSGGKDPIVGKWKNIRSGTVMILSADGKAYEYKVNFSMHGKWECIDDKGLTRKYRVNWEKGLHVYDWHLDTEGNKIHGKNGKVASTRIVE